MGFTSYCYLPFYHYRKWKIVRNMVEKEEVIIYSETDRVSCMGEMNDHPKVYYTIPKGGQVVCGYCDIIFRLKEEEDDI